ncbi:replication factor-a protein 1 (rpa1) family protein [Theileria parva strain Muguga]|uniref:replication factor-a protein 1 (rpa1) family protein n=1 Tax=Theileria parva strain Muguga TaxID=333668 RepID=UPI001C61BA07|nr:replication factor-a protein 1 (rpa1) family protein [Theileria parva strain Muguga]EAN32381.2 replication factor-a protein 1 (rpa1) family protein [Theileria parva strain Muguga]
MSLPRFLTRDFFSTLADSINNANEKYFQEVHECQTPVKLLCLQQSCIADNKYLIETLDGSVPVEYKHTCLALVPLTPDGDRQLIGKVISFTQYKVAPTKSRYLVVLTRISVVPGDYRHLIGHLVPALIYHPRLAVVQDDNIKNTMPELNSPVSGPVRKQENSRTVKTISNPYDPPVNKTKKDVPLTKISDLTLYTPKWSIRARVVFKSEIRKFNNQRGESQLFSVDLCDSNGEIRAVFFGESVNKWYSFLEEGQVYSISGGQLKPANKRFNNLKHTCELILDESSHIQLFQNDESIPSFCYSFTPLDQLQDVKSGETIDVIAIVVTAKDVQKINNKSTGNNVEKRDFLLCDSTNTTVWVTSWGQKTQLFNYQGENSHPLVCLKGVKVGEWQGKKLDVQGSTQVICEPVIPEALKLRKWWNENSQNVNFQQEVSKTTNSTFNKLCTISHIISSTNQGLQFKSIDSNGMVFTTRALIEVLKDTNFCFPSCTGCRKKMTNDQGIWYCPKCNSSTNPVHLYILNIKIVDETSHIWATAMSDVGESIMGIKAYKLIKLMENGPSDENEKNFVNYFEDARLTEYIFKIKATVENFMDEPRIKYRVLRATPLEKELDLAIKDRIENIKKLIP